MEFIIGVKICAEAEMYQVRRKRSPFHTEKLTGHTPAKNAKSMDCMETFIKFPDNGRDENVTKLKIPALDPDFCE